MNHPDLPSHLTDAARLAIATELLQKELRKLLPGLDSTARRALDSDVAAWPGGGAGYHLSEVPGVDFWDSFEAVLGQIKLKPLFIASLTAANVTWQKQRVALGKLTASTTLDQFAGLPFT